MQAFRLANFLRTVRPASTLRRSFHSSPSFFINVGDAIPDVEVQEGSPGNKLSIANEIKGKGLIIGVPAAFSPACSGSHIPGYIKHKSKLPQSVFVVSVNDAFVMKAWAESIPEAKETGIRFVADPSGKFTEALDLLFDGRAIFGGPRGKRYALLVEDGKVSKMFVEPDNTGVKVSAAENVLVF
ncbi:thioredoxin peroxidase/alkyl hydroperoxide reductase [Kalaharituber pfeilii]|nr:thioredoxin peroxidase/alkyl hydroperoxide reductase [Kalaharituber pfeilii]